MADMYVRRPRHPAADPVEMLYITIEGKRFGQPDEASLSFETKRGFGFRIRTEDAAELARKILRALARRKAVRSRKPSRASRAAGK